MKKLADNLYEIASVIMTSIIAIVILFTFIFRLVGVDGISMEPTLKENDWLITTTATSTYKYKDIVIVVQPTMLNKPLVKRVIGTEGDKVEIKDGGLYLNDKLIEHEYYIFSNEDNGLYILGNNQYFVLGDNIKVSEDSRYFGLIDEKDIKGQVILIFSPKKRFQLFNNIFHNNNISE